MSRDRITLADVAQAAGVSRTTASLVLSDRGNELRISEASQDRVRKVAFELGYRPNKLSTSLRSGTSRTLGFISDTVATSQLAGDMIRGALELARERGHMLFISETAGNESDQAQLIEAMLDHQVDGLIIASMFTREREVPRTVEGRKVVMLNTLPADPEHTFPTVIPDEYAAGRDAVRHLLDAGHRQIHLLGAGPSIDDVAPGTVAGRERLKGILDELKAAALIPASGAKGSIWFPEEGWKLTRALLSTGVRKGAIIAFNDRLAFGAYQAINEAGLSIPADFSIVSFDDAPLAGWLHPGLTTFAIPHRELGRRAVEILLDENDTPSQSPERLHMPLRERGSVMRLSV